jgi:hypothetical protein
VGTQRDGTITALPAEGATVTRGGALYRVDGKPVPLFYGPLPAWRALSVGVDDGPDVSITTEVRKGVLASRSTPCSPWPRAATRSRSNATAAGSWWGWRRACSPTARSRSPARAWPPATGWWCRHDASGHRAGIGAARGGQALPGAARGGGPARGRPDRREGRTAGHRRAERVRQVDPAAHHGHPGPADQRQRPGRRPGGRRAVRPRALGLPGQGRRLRVPAVLPRGGDDRPGQRRHRAALRRRARRRAAPAGRRGAGAGRARPPHDPQADPAVGRRASAGRDRQGGGGPAGHRAGRRAHREPRSATGAGVLDLLEELHAEGATIAVITHDQAIAGRLPRRVDLRDGRIERDVMAGAGA